MHRKFPATMPFGQHKGTIIRDIPTPYLAWAVEIARTPGLKDAIRQELDRRERLADVREGLADAGFGAPSRK